MEKDKKTIKPIWIFITGVIAEIIAYGFIGMESIVGALIAIMGQIFILAAIGNSLVNWFKNRKKRSN